MRQLFNIHGNEAIDNSKSVLLLELGDRHCCFAIVKQENLEAQKLVYYETDEGSQDLLNQVKMQHQELNDGFSDVLVNYSFPQSVMIPPRFYNSEDNKRMLQVLHGNEADVSFLSEHLPEWQLYNVYEVPRLAHSWISMQYHSGKYWHHYTLVLKNFTGDTGKNSLYADFKSGQFNVILVKSNQLYLTQTFVYTEPFDVIYYLLRICDGLGVSQKEVQLVLSGLLEEESALYKELYNYFINISFKKVHPGIALPPSFNEYPAYYFSSLFNLAACVS